MSSQSIIKTSHYMGRKHDTWVVERERDYNLPYIGGEGEVRGGSNGNNCGGNSEGSAKEGQNVRLCKFQLFN